MYETWDRGQAWLFKANLPITQFYKDHSRTTTTPFYNVYGGTQDNATLGGPSRTTSAHGIVNSRLVRDHLRRRLQDPQIEPGNPDIVYSQYQYGGLARYDRQAAVS